MSVTCPKVVLFYAMEKERDNIILPVMKDLKISGDDVWLAQLGVGKVAAATNASILLSGLRMFDYRPICINVGVCGGNAEAFESAPCGVIDFSVENDFDTSVLDGSPYVKPLFKISESACVTTGEHQPIPPDSKICFTQDRVSRNTKDFALIVGEKLAVNRPIYSDMELSAVAFVCAAFQTKLIAIKSISDVIGSPTQKEDYWANGFDLACERARVVLRGYLERLLK